MDIWCGNRFPRNGVESLPEGEVHRSDFQQDYDRLLFSTPVRRLADKTQVWPMDDNDGVRTRLTHSHEVANLARSIGAKVFSSDVISQKFGSPNFLHVVQPILSSIGLGHDLGNPPFGHQGEASICRWFKCRESWIFDKKFDGGSEIINPIDVQGIRDEFLCFDGNPQAIRLISRLQSNLHGNGLDLTAATLAASIKYPCSYIGVDKKNKIKKKAGYFKSEESVVKWVWSKTGLGDGMRHPLTWIMEACDDIAYSVLDVDDLLKKSIISPEEVISIVERECSEDCFDASWVKDKFESAHGVGKSHHIVRDLKIQFLRAAFMKNLIEHASQSFMSQSGAISDKLAVKPLMDDSRLCECLKKIAVDYALNSPLVLRSEASGAVVIDGLMSALWSAISDREIFDDLTSRRRSLKSKFVFSLISHNYIDVAVSDVASHGVRYAELRLLTDMVSGMTDSYATKLWVEIKEMENVCCA